MTVLLGRQTMLCPTALILPVWTQIFLGQITVSSFTQTSSSFIASSMYLFSGNSI